MLDSRLSKAFLLSVRALLYPDDRADITFRGEPNMADNTGIDACGPCSNCKDQKIR